MHPNPAFRGELAERNLAFARTRGFGTLAVTANPAPLLSHIPFLLSDDGTSADLHLVRSNPIARLGATPAVLAVTGPDGYISPDWYETPDQVPTWNYVAVHLRGRLEPLPHEALRTLLDRLSAHFEAELAPKLPWTAAKMTPDALDRMMRQILPFRLHVETVDGTWKLGQNKPETARLGAAGHVAGGVGAELTTLSALMRDA
jgi:transcriptional regulator